MENCQNVEVNDCSIVFHNQNALGIVRKQMGWHQLGYDKRNDDLNIPDLEMLIYIYDTNKPLIKLVYFNLCLLDYDSLTNIHQYILVIVVFHVHN